MAYKQQLLRFTCWRLAAWAVLFMLWSLAISTDLHAQCYGGTLFPPDIINVPDDGTQQMISDQSWSGDRVQVALLAGRTYRFTSSVNTDLLTISNAEASNALTWGTTPLHFTATSDQVYFLHIFASSLCETITFSDRTTTVFRSHCQAGASNCGGSNEAIVRVAIGSINHTSSGCEAGGYSDFSHLSTDIVAGASLPILVENLNPFSGDLVRVYVDWDRNFQFDDAGGSFLLGTTDHATFTGMVSAPPGTTPGPVRMRVRLNYLDNGGECGTGDYGEVEDYTLVVNVFGSGMFAGGGGRGEGRMAWQGSPSLANRYGGGAGRGEASQRYAVPITLPLSVVAFIEGPYDPSNGLMNDALRNLATFPLTEPYTTLGYGHTGGGGGETILPAVLAVTGTDAIVDWVLVELRDEGDASTVVASRSGLLQRDGDIVDTDGTSHLTFQMPAGNYHVAVLHRNHLGVMAAAAQSLGPTPTSLDLGSAATATHGTDASKSIAGTFPKQVLWAGDVTFDGLLKYTGADNDRDPILVSIGGLMPTSTISGYHGEDVNLDGVVKYTGAGNDREPILLNLGGSTPTNMRLEQLP